MSKGKFNKLNRFLYLVKEEYENEDEQYNQIEEMIGCFLNKVKMWIKQV